MEFGEDTSRVSGITHAAFNQNETCLCLGTVAGCIVYNLGTMLTKAAAVDVGGGYRIAKMLFSTSLLAVVPADNPRQVQLLNSKSDSGPILQLNYVTPVLDVHLNMVRLVVVLENKIHLYDIKKMESIFTIDTNPNPRGVCALSITNDSLIAYPQSNEDGTVVLFDGVQLEVINVFSAHTSRLRCLAFNRDGSLLASASEKGTVVHVNEVGPGSKIRRRVGYDQGSGVTTEDAISERDTYAFRRGSFAANVTAVGFSPDSSLLFCCSLSGTIHVFRIQRVGQAQPSMVSSFLPTMIAGMWEPQRSAVVVRAVAEQMMVLAVSDNNREIRTLAADGKYRTYRMDVNEGGEGELVQEIDLSLPADVLESSVRARFV